MKQGIRERLDIIKFIISSKEIGNQVELLMELANNGCELTQATLSRDLKRLNVVKGVGASGRYVYVLPNESMYKQNANMLQAIDELKMNLGFVSINFSGNLAVIKTRPGYASRLAYDIDNHEYHEILGTIAGDDTILLIMKEGVNQQTLLNTLSAVIPVINK